MGRVVAAVILLLLPVSSLILRYRRYVLRGGAPRGFYRDTLGREWENRSGDI